MRRGAEDEDAARDGLVVLRHGRELVITFELVQEHNIRGRWENPQLPCADDTDCTRIQSIRRSLKVSAGFLDLTAKSHAEGFVQWRVGGCCKVEVTGYVYLVRAAHLRSRCIHVELYTRRVVYA